MFKKNIVFKLTIGYILIILISTLSIGAFFIDLFKDYTIENRKMNMVQKANEVASMVEPYLADLQDTPEYNSLVNLIYSLVNAKVWIADKDGTVLLMSSNGSEGLKKNNQYNAAQFDKEFVDNVLKGQEVVKEEYNNFYGELTLSAGVPIKNSSNKIEGMVIFHSPMSGVTSTIDKVFGVLIFAILLEIILAGILGFYYSRFITKPIRLMNSSAMEMAKGNYKVRTNLFQKDEIGELAGSLDMLASKLDYTVNQLFQEKNKLENLFSSMSEGILAFDLNLELVNLNESAQRVLGYSSNEIINNLRTDFKRQGILEEFLSVIRNEEKNVLVKPWNDRILRLSISTVKNNLYEVVGVVVLIQDISEQEKLEQMRKDFIANVSHEFRTPLTLIRGSLEAMIDGAVAESLLSKYYNNLLEETKGLERMVNDLLDLSKLESGKINFNFEELNITDLIIDVSRNMQFIANKKNIKINNSFKNNTPPIWGDYDRLKQLLIIFIDNAIKYSSEDSEMFISTYLGEYAYIKIKDCGIGIPEEEIPYIWERFYKVDKARKSRTEGTGLGLAIAKHIIELSKGTVKIESKVNQGTTIEIGLPLFNGMGHTSFLQPIL